MSENGVLRRIFGAKNEVTREYRKLHNEDLNLLTPNVNYSGRTASLTSKVAFYIFIQQI